MNHYTRIVTILIVLLYLCCNFYISVYFNYESLNSVGFLFGHSFHWHTIALSTMTNCIVFLISQCFAIIQKPTKLVFIPTFVPFNIIYNHYSVATPNNSKYDNRFTIVNNDKYSFNDTNTLEINENETLLYVMCCRTDNDLFLKISYYLFSKPCFCVCGSYFIFLTIFCMMANIYKNMYVAIFLYVLVTIVITIAILSLNYQILKFITKKFMFWWKIQDACVFAIMEIFTAVKASHYGDSTLWCILLSIYAFNVVITVFAISSIKAYVSSNNWKKLNIIVINTIIVMPGIASFIYVAIAWFINDSFDYVITVNSKLTNYSFEISCKTILIEKSIDLAIFFMSQLYDNIRYGSRMNGIQVKGEVERKWNKYKIDGDANSQLQTELINVSSEAVLTT